MIRGIMPQGGDGALAPMRVSFGEYQLDTELGTLERNGRRVELQDKAFDVLVYLIEHRERFVPQEELLDALWPGVHVGSAALSKAVQKARQAINDDGDQQTVLRTKHGHGFRFVAEVADLSEPEAARPAPARFRTRVAAVAGIAALLLVVALVWLLQRQTTDRIRGHALAVLPFADMSADADQEYFADGIAEELLNTLAHFEGLRVVGRTSSFSFKNSDADLKTIGEALGADVILEGSVRTVGDRVRITAQLVDAEDGFHRWSETYDRELGDIFAIQTEIATAIADALRVSLSLEERERLATVSTENLVAYQAYLLGRQRLAKETAAASAEAVTYFQRAIELDPSFALAYVGLADAYDWQFNFSGLPPEELLAKAQAATDKALELDDRLGEAYSSLGNIKLNRYDYEGAEAAFQRALELNPNYATAYYSYGELLSWKLGRFEEGLALRRKALELNPLSAAIISNVAEDLANLGRFDEALAWYEKALEVDPGFTHSYRFIAGHYWFVSGQLDEAAVWLGRSLSFDPGNPEHPALLGELFMDLGDPGQAEYWVNRSNELGPDTYWANSAMVTLHLYRGDEAAALDYGRKLLAIYPREFLIVAPLRNHELRVGRYLEARALYEENYPELLNEDDPKIFLGNYLAAIDLALVLSKTGEQERADLLLNRSLQYIQTIQRLGWNGYGIADVQIHALRDDKEKALAALRQAIDEGWRYFWWYFLKLDPNLESLHDEPEFQAMFEEIEADMAEQLARVREMERNGELEPISEVSAATQ